MEKYARRIEEVIETLKQGKDHGRKCTLLIGAGCSVSAGIPTAQGFVDYIKDNYPSAYQRAEEKTYPQLMATLGIGQRRDIIAHFVDNSKINWAHIAIAQLMKCNYVDRVLTTNFDQLIMRAGALVGVFPAIYDFAASQTYKPADIPERAVFHLHGQRSGFKLLNTEEEVTNLKNDLIPVFEDAGRGRTWIVVGYSGDNDPVFEHLTNVACYDHNFYWITYKDTPPGKNVFDNLCVSNKQAYYVQGYDADSFFINLAQKLDCFPPNLTSKPFTHVLEMLDMLTPFPLMGEESTLDTTAETRKQVKEAIERYEEGKYPDTPFVKKEEYNLSTIITKANEKLMAGDYQSAIELLPNDFDKISGSLIDTASWAYLLDGNAKVKQYKAKNEINLLQSAIEKYSRALEIKPNLYEALNNWGNVLIDQAKTKTGDESDILFKSAAEKYIQALEVKPDDPSTLYNFGNVYLEQAKLKTNEEADMLFKLAAEKYKQALEINPELYLALNNLGISINGQIKTAENTDTFRKNAIDKYKESLKIKPDFYKAMYNWGNLLLEQAKTKLGEEAEILHQAAIEKFKQALEIKPDMYEALNSWGNIFLYQAKTKFGEKTDSLYQAAIEKFKQALEIKPDMYEALSHWGFALLNQAQIKSGKEAHDLLEIAGEKFAQSLELKPDNYDALNGWGAILVDQAQTKSGKEAHNFLEIAGEKFAQSLELKSDNYDALNGWGAALASQAFKKFDIESDLLYENAYQKYNLAQDIKPNRHEALSNWGGALANQAQTKLGEEADELFSVAFEKFDQSFKINSDNIITLNSWGAALINQAQTKTGEEANILWESAIEKYTLSLEVEPNNFIALNDFGNILINQAKTKFKKEANELFELAKEKCSLANQISQGSGSYNLACISALQGVPKEAKKWLNESLATDNLPPFAHLEGDFDLDSLRELGWFKEFLGKIES